jgi:two-component system, cell cycle sensor histidine kinase and response regulator CckA
MDKSKNILIVEGSENYARLLLRELRNNGCQPSHARVDTPEAMREALETGNWDVILSGCVMPGFSGIAALKILKESGLDLPFIIVTGKIGQETAVQLMKAGAHDYVMKRDLARLAPAIKREMQESAERRRQRETEDALRESERRYRLLLESVTDYIYTTLMEDGRPVSTSHGPGCVAVTGYTPEEYAADSGLWLQMVHEEERAAVVAQADLVLAGKAPPSLEHRIVHKDGLVRWIRNTQVPRYNREGLLIACDGIVADITGRKKAEEEIRKVKEEWEQTFDAITDPIMILDTGHRIVKANKAVAEKLGISPSEAVGLNCYREVHGLSEPPSYCPHARLMTDGQPHSTEIYEPRIGGHFLVDVSPLYDTHGKLHGSVHYARDISERKHLETQLRHVQKMEAIGTLAGGIAHDFNNVLTAIIGYGHLTTMEMTEDDPLRHNVEQILAAADRAATLTHSLLAFSRKQVLDTRPVDLGKIIRNVEGFLKRIIGEDIQLRTEVNEDALTACADSSQIEQVLMNLATNARDAMPDGGSLVIGATRTEIDGTFVEVHGYGAPGSYVLVTVADTGQGMDQETAQRMFEPFFTTKEFGKGTGLGLSIVYGIVKQHSGYINAYSEPGQGTTFKIYLPLISVSPVTLEKITLPYPLGGTETVLVAEDDPTVRSLTTSILTGFGYTVIEARDGEEAIARFRDQAEEISLCLFDVIMPKKKGWEAYEEIGNIRQGVKVLFMSGYQADNFPHHGKMPEGAAFIAKPVVPRLLLQKVRELLDG